MVGADGDSRTRRGDASSVEEFQLDEGAAGRLPRVGATPAGKLGIRRWCGSRQWYYPMRSVSSPSLKCGAELEWSINWCGHPGQPGREDPRRRAQRDGRALGCPAAGAGQEHAVRGAGPRGWRLLSASLPIDQPRAGILGAHHQLKNESIEVIRRWAPAARLSTRCPKRTRARRRTCARRRGRGAGGRR